MIQLSNPPSKFSESFWLAAGSYWEICFGVDLACGTARFVFGDVFVSHHGYSCVRSAVTVQQRCEIDLRFTCQFANIGICELSHVKRLPGDSVTRLSWIASAQVCFHDLTVVHQ